MLFSFIKNQNTCSLMYVPLPCSFIIMSMMLQEVKKNLDWSSNHQRSSRPKMSSVGEKEKMDGVGYTAGSSKQRKRKSKNSKQKKRVGSFPYPLILGFWELDRKIIAFSLENRRSP